MSAKLAEAVITASTANVGIPQDATPKPTGHKVPVAEERHHDINVDEGALPPSGESGAGAD